MDQSNNATDIARLRVRLLDLQRTLSLTPEAFGLYQETILQLHKECERRKITCFDQAQQLRTQAAAVESQGHAFSAMASITFAVVNGYIELEEKRIREEAERAAEKAEAAADTPPVLAAPAEPLPPVKRKPGRPRKVVAEDAGSKSD